MERVTEQEYREAQKIVDRYIDQLKQDRLNPYKGCVVSDIVAIKGKSMYNEKQYYYWVHKGVGTPERNPDQTITEKGENFYTIENSSKVYENHEDAKKAIIQSFKRKKLIDNE